MKTRLVTLRMFATGNEERCPVIKKPVSRIWYKKTLVGKNIINIIMKNMKNPHR